MADDRLYKPWWAIRPVWPTPPQPMTTCAGCGKPRNRLSTWIVADGRRLCRPCLSGVAVVPETTGRRRAKATAK